MSDSGLARYAPLTGVLFVLLAIVSFALFGDEPPAADDPVREIVSFWADADDGLGVSVIFQSLACVALVFFGGSLFHALRRAAPGSFLPPIAFAGVIILATGLLVDAAVILTLQQAADDMPPAAIQAFNAFYENDYPPMGAGVFIMLLSSAIVILRAGGLPKWMGWAALVLVVVAPTPIGFASFIGGALWMAIAGIVLTMRSGAEPAPAA